MAPQYLDLLNPFHLRLSREGEIIALGKSLAKLLGASSAIGLHFSNKFDFTAPVWDPALCSANTGEIVVRGNRVKLRYFRYDEKENGILFFLTPLLHSSQDVIAGGLVFSDFSPIDPVFDQVMMYEVLRANQQTLQKKNDALERNILRNQVLSELAQASMDATSFSGLLEVLARVAAKELKWDLVRPLANSGALEGDKKVRLDSSAVSQDRNNANEFQVRVIFPVLTDDSDLPIGALEFFSRTGRADLALDLADLEQLQKRIAVVFSRLSLKMQIDAQTSKLVANSKLAVLGEMAGGIAHEINNPLAVIVGKVGLMENMLADPQKNISRIRESIEKISRMSERITKIIRGLSAFARNAESDPKKIEKLGEIIEDAIDLCNEKLKHGRVKLELNIDNSIQVECRPTQISQVIMNLISNSYDAIQASENAWIRLSALMNSNVVEIEVLDSGGGIPPHIVESMMQPFFTTKPVGKGTGLGLSIAKGIIEEHGGVFSYDAKSPNTRFLIQLPKVKN